jgi:hypothetical protein
MALMEYKIWDVEHVKNILSTRVVPRLGARASISRLPKELFRNLAGHLYALQQNEASVETTEAIRRHYGFYPKRS